MFNNKKIEALEARAELASLFRRDHANRIEVLEGQIKDLWASVHSNRINVENALALSKPKQKKK